MYFVFVRIFFSAGTLNPLCFATRYVLPSHNIRPVIVTIDYILLLLLFFKLLLLLLQHIQKTEIRLCKKKILFGAKPQFIVQIFRTVVY